MKARLITGVAATAALIGFRELSKTDIGKGNFEITVITNGEVQHAFVFDYHCKLLSLEHFGDLSLMRTPAMMTLADIITLAKDLRN